ncbi:MAG: carbonic anhydrase [Candidatus Eiseniibacteriota bacterium]
MMAKNRSMLRLHCTASVASVILMLAVLVATPPTACADGTIISAHTVHAADLKGPDRALAELMAGNARFAAHQSKHPNQNAARLTEVADGQHPIAVVLSCADSRVPPEVIFDQGLGDIFTVRVAGNVTSPEVLGSIEYAVEHLGATLIVVMGHEKCGAVAAALAGGDAGGHVQTIVNEISPVIEVAKQSSQDPLDQAVRLNVFKTVGELSTSEPILAHEASEGKIKIVGAYYSLDTGQVSLIGAPPAAAKH